MSTRGHCSSNCNCSSVHLLLLHNLLPVKPLMVSLQEQTGPEGIKHSLILSSCDTLHHKASKMSSEWQENTRMCVRMYKPGGTLNIVRTLIYPPICNSHSLYFRNACMFKDCFINTNSKVKKKSIISHFM